MAFRTLQALLSVTLAASAAHGQVIETKVPDAAAQYNRSDLSEVAAAFNWITELEPVVYVHYKQMISPETFTFNENVAWALQSLWWPDETLGKAVIMYGYDFNSACDASAARNLDTPAALAIQVPLDSADVDPVKSVTLYEDVSDACDAREVVQQLAKTYISSSFSEDAGLEDANEGLANFLLTDVRAVSWSPVSGSGDAAIDDSELLELVAAEEGRTVIPGYLPVDTSTAVSIADKIAEIERANGDSMIFSVGRLPGVGRGIEMWAFCADVAQCLGHQTDTIFASGRFAGFVDSNLDSAPSQSPQSMQPAEGPDG